MIPRTMNMRRPHLNTIAATPLSSLELTDATGSGAAAHKSSVRVAISKVKGESL